MAEVTAVAKAEVTAEAAMIVPLLRPPAGSEGDNLGLNMVSKSNGAPGFAHHISRHIHCSGWAETIQLVDDGMELALVVVLHILQAPSIVDANRVCKISITRCATSCS